MAHNRQYQQGNSHRNSFIGSSAMMDSLGNISGSGGGSDSRRYSQLVAHQGGEFQPPSPSYRHEGGGSGGNSGRGSRRNSLLAAAVTASSNQAHRSSVIYTDYNTGMSPPVYHSGNDSKRQSMIYGGSGDASPLAAGAHYSGSGTHSPYLQQQQYQQQQYQQQQQQQHQQQQQQQQHQHVRYSSANSPMAYSSIGMSSPVSPLVANSSIPNIARPYIGHSRSGSGVTSPLTASQSAGNESIPALNSSVIMNPHQFNASIANMSAYQRHQIQPSDSGSKTLNGSEQTTTSKEGEEDDDDDDNVPVAVIASQQQQQQQLLLQQKRLSHVSTTDVRRSQLLSIPTADQRLSLIEAGTTSAVTSPPLPVTTATTTGAAAATATAAAVTLPAISSPLAHNSNNNSDNTNNKQSDESRRRMTGDQAFFLADDAEELEMSDMRQLANIKVDSTTALGKSANNGSDADDSMVIDNEKSRAEKTDNNKGWKFSHLIRKNKEPSPMEEIESTPIGGHVQLPPVLMRGGDRQQQARSRSCFGVCPCNPRLCAGITFGILLIIGLIIFFVFPRVPEVVVTGITPKSAARVEYSPSKYKYSLEVDVNAASYARSSNFYPLTASRIEVEAYVSGTSRQLGKTTVKNVYWPSQTITNFNFDVTLNYTAVNLSDDAILKLYSSCAPASANLPNNLGKRIDPMYVKLIMKIYIDLISWTKWVPAVAFSLPLDCPE